MEIFVRSRWQSNPQGLGYFWKPSEPDVAKKIECYNELVTDYSCIMALWASYQDFFPTCYYLYLTGLDAGYSDLHNRPIKHTIVWKTEDTNSDLQQLRMIMLQFASGQLEKKLVSLIHSDEQAGFIVDGSLKKIGQSQHECSSAEKDTFIENSSLSKFKEYLPNEKFSFSGFSISANRLQGLMGAIGKDFSLGRFKNHKFLKFVFDPLINRLERHGDIQN